MPVDPEYLRQHYSSLSDEGLEEIDRRDLVDVARACYDEEIRKRKLDNLHDGEPVGFDQPEGGEYEQEPVEGDDEDWLEDAAVVYSNMVHSGTAPAPDAANARDILEAAGIPCHLELIEIPQEEHTGQAPPTHQWRLMVPGQLNLQATSVLDRDVFNADFEAEWRAHLEAFSDEELRAMHPKIAFCGLFDRIERVTRAYNEELARRK